MTQNEGGHIMPNLIKAIHLTEGEKAALEGVLRQSTVEARSYIRAKILLLKAESKSNEYIADKLDICVSSVRLCIDKYHAGGIEAALEDTKGRGRKAEITDADITWVIHKACQKPKDVGYSAELWYPASFTRFIHHPSNIGICDFCFASPPLVVPQCCLDAPGMIFFQAKPYRTNTNI